MDSGPPIASSVPPTADYPTLRASSPAVLSFNMHVSLDSNASLVQSDGTEVGQDLGTPRDPKSIPTEGFVTDVPSPEVPTPVTAPAVLSRTSETSTKVEEPSSGTPMEVERPGAVATVDAVVERSADVAPLELDAQTGSEWCDAVRMEVHTLSGKRIPLVAASAIQQNDAEQQ